MSAAPPFFKLDVEGAENVFWRIARVSGKESLDAPWRFVIVAEALAGTEPVAPDLDGLLAKKATLTCFSGEQERTFHGLVDEVSLDATQHELVLVPRVALLEDGADQKVFLDKDAVEIAREILTARGLRVDARVHRDVPKRPQCVQAFESDLAFVSRLLADDGITWFAAPNEEDVIVLAEDAKSFPELDEPAVVIETGGLLAGRSVHRAHIAEHVVPSAVTLRDYNFETPQVELQAKAGSGDLEVYECPGAFDGEEQGRARAELRLEELRARERVLTGESNARDLAPGRVIELSGELPGVDGKWLLVAVEHEGIAADAEGDQRYVARFTATPRDTRYRPARRPAPRISGVQNAVTVGPPSQELHTDQHARVRAQLRWDRRGEKDDKASAWVRSLQPPTSGGFMLPRVGWEVLLGFVGTSADEPIVLGRLANGAAPPPDTQPANKTASAFGSLTTPGGGTKNLVRLDDAGGKETFGVVASYDLNERTENDKVTGVVGNTSATVGANRKVIVGEVHSVGITGAETHSVGGSREVSVDANMQVTAAAETIAIGAVRTFKVGGDSAITSSTLARCVGAAKIETAIEHQSRVVTGAASVAVAGSWNAVAGTHASVSVGGSSSETVGGPKSVRASNGYTLQVKGSLSQSFASRSVDAGSSHDEGFAGSATYDISGSAKMKGADVVVVASSKITLKADGITLEITPSGVKIAGKFDGSVGAVDSGDEDYG